MTQMNTTSQMQELDKNIDIASAEPDPQEAPVISEEHAERVRKLHELLHRSKSKRSELIDLHNRMRRQVVGRLHPSAGNGDEESHKSPINIARRQVEHYTTELFPIAWSVACEPKSDANTAGCALRQAVVQHYVEETNMAMEARDAGIDALLCGEGLLFTANCVADFPELTETVGVDPGELCTVRIDPEDFAHDPDSVSHRKDTWYAVRFSVSKRHLRKAGDIPAAVIDALKSESKMRGDDADFSVSDTEYVSLWRWWFFSGTTTTTCTTSEEYGGFVRAPAEYEGPVNGPISYLCFGKMPGLRFGMSPISGIAEASLHIDSLTRKAVNQALRSKAMVGIDVENATMKTQIEGTSDVVMYLRSGPSPEAVVTQLKMLDAEVMSLVEWLINQANQSTAMQSRQVGEQGLAKTAYEASVLREQSMQSFSDLQEIVGAWHQEAIHRVAHFADAIIKSEAVASDKTTYRTASPGVAGNLTATENDAEYTAAHFHFSLSTSAKVPNDPVRRLDAMMQTVTGALQTAAMLQQFGVDPSGFLASVVKLSSPDVGKSLGSASDGITMAAHGVVNSQYAKAAKVVM